MAVDVEVKLNERKLRQLQQLFASYPRALPKIMSRSVNRAATKTRTAAGRAISRILNIKAKTAKEAVSLTKANYRNWTARLHISGRRIPLIEFGGTWQRRWAGAKYRIKREGGRETAEGAFIASVGSGHRGIFRRAGESRLPIYELYGPSVGAVMVGATTMLRTLEKDAGRELEKNIDSQVKLLLEQQGRAAG